MREGEREERNEGRRGTRIALSYYKLLDHYLSFWEHLAHALLTHEDAMCESRARLRRAYMRNALVYPHPPCPWRAALTAHCFLLQVIRHQGRYAAFLNAVLVPIGQGRSVHCKGLRSHCEIALGSRISGLGLRLRRIGLAKFLGAGSDLVFRCVSSINSALGRSEVSFARLVSNCPFDFIEAITSFLRVCHRQS